MRHHYADWLRQVQQAINAYDPHAQAAKAPPPAAPTHPTATDAPPAPGHADRSRESARTDDPDPTA